MTKYKHPDNLVSKYRKVLDYYHETCGKFLSGNGSMAFPYTCDCGTWEYDIDHYGWRLKKKQYSIDVKR
jgi:hypothetical protein